MGSRPLKDQSDTPAATPQTAGFLGAIDGETAALVRAHDWSKTPLGPIEAWPQSLKTTVELMLSSRFPMFTAWGEGLTFLYNDAYVDVLGGKHPRAMGRPFHDIWSEIWSDISPMIDAAMDGRATYFENLPLTMNRKGHDEQTWFTFSYSPVRDDSGAVAGMFCACVETTATVLAEQQNEQARERLDMALSVGVGVGTWDWDVPNDRVYADERFARLYGVDPDLARRGAPLSEFFQNIHSADAEALQVQITEALTTGDLFQAEYRLVQADGDVRWVAAEGRASLSPEGQPVRFPGVTFDITERRKADDALRESEARYRTLFDSVEAGFCIVQMKFDEAGRAVDYMIVEGNSAFAELTGLKDADGKWVSEIAPGLERHWFDAYGRVALTGEPARFENQAGVFGRWYDVEALRIGAPEQHRVAILFTDLTARKQLERRQAALIALGDAVADLDDPAEIGFASAGVLGEALGASRAAYGVIDDEAGAITIARDWRIEGQPSVAGRHLFSDYGSFFDDLRRGEAVTIADVTKDPRTASDPKPLLDLNIHALLDVPLVEHGKTVAQILVHCAHPREWTADEVAFVREFADRTRALVTRREAERLVRERQDELQRLADSLPLLVSRVDRDLRYAFNNRAYEAWFGMTPEAMKGRHVREVIGEAAFKKLKPNLDRALAGERFSVDQTSPYPSGTRHTRVDYVPNLDAAGRPDGFYAIVQDVSAQRDADLRQRVLLELNDAVRDLTDPAEIAHASSEILARALNVSRVGYGVMDTVAETVTIERDYNAPGVKSIAGVIHFRDFGDYIENLARGEVVVFADAAQDPRVGDGGAALAGISATSLINLPLLEQGKVVALLFVNNATPRDWSDGDVALVREVAERVRTAAERARANAALRENEARLRFLDDLNIEVGKVSDADAILDVTTRMTARHLGVDNCAYADMDADQDGFTIRGDWAAPGMASIVGHYQLANFGRLAVQELGAGRPLIINDNLKEIAPEEAAAFQALGISATICMPLVKAGRLTALMAIHHRQPHVWTDEELATIREVTERSWAHVERVRTDAALRERESRLRALVTTTNAVLYRMSPDWSQMWRLDGQGFLKDTIDASEAWAEDYIPDDEKARVAAAVAKAIKARSLFELEHRVRQADGNIGWTLSRAVPILGPDGEIAEWFGAAADITARVEAEVERNLSQVRYQALFDAIDEGFCIIEFVDGPEGPLSDYVHVEANAAYAANAGIPDVVGQRVRDMVGDEAQSWIDLYKGVLDTGAPIRFEKELEETARWLELAAFRVEPAERNQVAVLFKDLTARKLAERALMDSEERLRLAMEAGGQGAWELGLKSLELSASDHCKANFGWEPGAPFTYDDLNEAVDPRDRERMQTAVRNAIETGETYDIEYRIVRPDGRPGWVQVRGQPYYADDGSPLRMIGVSMDVTARKDAELALQDLNATLEERVAERTGELQAAHEALRQSQKMEAVGQLTGGIAHDFNNLLAGISGALELLSKRMAEGRTAGMERYIDAAQGSAQRAAALTQRLLAFSRRQTLDPRPTDVNRLIAGMEDLVRRSVGPNVQVEVVGAGGLWPVQIDQGQLENALLNLCINARDAMAPDGGRLTIETANKWLDERHARVSDLNPGQYVSLCVSDTGTGMSPEIIARIFDPFFTTKPLGQGTGLGLSMIHGFVRQSGGQVRVYSEPGQGTTMCLYLPRFLGEVEAPGQAADVQVAEGGAGETVLVIDDDETVRMLVTEVLREAGYRVVGAGDGPSGLEILRSDARIDLLITDVGLPGGMNGRQVADAARETRPALKVLFITGYAENAAVGNGLLDAGMEVMTKPFVMSDLALKVHEMVEG